LANLLIVERTLTNCMKLRSVRRYSPTLGEFLFVGEDRHSAEIREVQDAAVLIRLGDGVGQKLEHDPGLGRLQVETDRAHHGVAV
jgi:hypothetical protein